MGQIFQEHSGLGDNVGNKITNVNNFIITDLVLKLPKYLNAFPTYDLGNFVRGKSHLTNIKKSLSSGNFLLLNGIGGIGKTTLAKAYITCFQDDYDHIAYIEIVNTIADSMLGKFANTGIISFKNNPNLDLEENFKILIDSLRIVPRLLIVLDNANDTDDLTLRKDQLYSLNANILITGRARPQELVYERKIKDIPGLTSKEALSLFKKYYKAPLNKVQHKQVESILQGTFYHPALIEILARTAYEYPFLNLDKIQTFVDKKQFKDICIPIKIDDQSKTVYRILLDLFDTILLSDMSKRLLRYFSILPNIDIPVADLATLFQITDESDLQELANNLNLLTSSGWLKDFHKRHYFMHGLVSWVIRQRLIPTTENCYPLINGIGKAIHFTPHENPLDKQIYLQYASELHDIFGDQHDLALAETYNNLAGLLREVGNHTNALLYHIKSLNILEAKIAIDDFALTAPYINIAETYGEMGDYNKALEYQLKSLKILEKEISFKDTDLAQSYSNIAETYRELGYDYYPKSLEYNYKAVRIRRKTLPDHPHLAISYNYIGLTYWDMGKPQKALEFHRKALFIRKAKLQSQHPDLSQSFNNIALVYRALGKYRIAIYYHERSLEIREAIQPVNCFDLCISYNTIAVTYRALGDSKQALLYSHKSVDVGETGLSKNNPHLGSANNNLARIYLDLNESEKALPPIIRAVNIFENSLPPNHPRLATAYYNLALTYQNLNDSKNALDPATKSLLNRSVFLPTNHTDLINSENLLKEIRNKLDKQ